VDGGAITLGILAGGRASRLAGADKSTLEFRGETLLKRTLASLGRDGETCLLSHRDDVAIPGLRVVRDLRADQPGPLAGLEALLGAAHTPWLLTAPVDLADIPPALGAALRARAAGKGATVVRDADGLQPLVAIWPVAAALRAVRAALDAGERSVRAMLDTLPHAVLDIAPARLGNLNTPADFVA
jgi:molybdopterin-guanine dinucleotide biosynthesis protein A